MGSATDKYLTRMTFEQWENTLRVMTSQSNALADANEQLAKMVKSIGKISKTGKTPLRNVPVSLRTQLAGFRHGALTVSAVDALKAAQRELKKHQAQSLMLQCVAQELEDYGRNMGWLDRVTHMNEYS